VFKYASLRSEVSHLKTLAVTDELTNLYIYRYFVLKLKYELNLARNEGKDISLVIMDIDLFKQFNDTYGHEQGNLILKAFAGFLMQLTRKQETICRYGGEEFVVILPDTAQHQAVKYAEKIRRAVEKCDFPGPGGPLKITLSFGVAGMNESKAETAEELTKFADACLYQAKREGRNRVSFYAKSQ